MNPAEARFCMACGASLVASAEERRTVSVLFADLIGFTERSDAADPEDVRRTLVPFHERAKDAIERFGGTLDKFIGDAAMGVFGAPTEHEDDPERAVRAAFDLIAASEGAHPIRVAVNTGEAVVTSGTGPQVGEAVAGDVVNTTSRMQSVAPAGGLVIGEVTWLSVRDRFECEELDPFTAKGKAEPIRVWRVTGEREVAMARPSAPLIGRRHELEQLLGAMTRAIEERCAQLVTVVADPGIGKSRLVAELRQRLGDEVTWLESACGPYGDANALTALDAIVRELVGLGAGDDAADVNDALASLVARAEPAESERAWLRSRLASLTDVGRADEREGQVPLIEVAAAAARLLSASAAEHPLVIAIEDLHWSESVLRSVLATIADDVAEPIVVLCTARPELFDVDPAWGGGRANSSTLRLQRLSDEETTSLVEALLAASVLTDTERQSVLRNIGGNPLFAVEFARMLVDRRVEQADVPMSVQAVIGARLDSVTPDLRLLLQDAAVIGARFWPDALVELGDIETGNVRGSLAELARRGLIVRSGDSWFPEQAEYGFGHALIREVAYARLPRMTRARKHATTGRWLERVVGTRRDAFADALAHHFEQAVLLAEASGEPDEAAEWRDRAVDALQLAGEVAMSLDAAGGFARFDRAVAICPEDDPRWAAALAHSALAGRRSGRLESIEVLRRQEQVIAFHHARGDPVAEARGRASIAGQLMALARHDEARGQLATAAELLAGEPEAAAERALVNAWMAEERMFAGLPGPAAEFSGRALEGGATEPVAIMALHIRGDSRIALGDPGGVEDLRDALARAQALGSVSDIVTSYNYLADREWQEQGPAAALELLDEASDLADRRGAFSQGSWTKVAALELLSELGRWDELLERAEPLAAETRLDESLQVSIALWMSAVHLNRRESTVDMEEPLERARFVEDLQVLAPALVMAARAAVRAGDPDRALALLREFDEQTAGKAAMYRTALAPGTVRLLVEVGSLDLAAGVVSRSEAVTMRDALFVDTAEAIVRRAQGAREPEAWVALEERWRAYGDPFEEAHAALALGDVISDETVTARGRVLLDKLGVPA
jgi:class 3 adenylate cyclase/tetratricopeptide (TPR) repeat protein